MLWLTEMFNIYPRWVFNYLKSTAVFVAFSLNALVVMSFERYLATSYPVFYRTSVTKRKLLTLFAVLNIVTVTLVLLCVNEFAISYEVCIFIGFNIYFPPMLAFNCKLFMVAGKSRRNNKIAPETKKSFSFKNISSCVLAVACFLVLFTPALAYVGFKRFSKENEHVLNNSNLAGLWAITVSSMNSTFNCLIFTGRTIFCSPKE